MDEAEAWMSEDALERAMRRLDAALSALEIRWAEHAVAAAAEPDLFAAQPTPPPPPMDDGRVADLEAQVDSLRTRERALEQVAAEASAALGRAAAEVRAALSAEA